MRASHSRVECYEKCPYQYRLRYLDGLKTLPNFDDPANPLVIGHALHTGIEQGVSAAILEYYSFFPCISDLHVHEAMKLEILIPKVKSMLPEKAEFEVEIADGNNFVGYIDLLDRNNGEIWDFKYSKNVDRYMQSRQLHVYKYYAEKLLGVHINKLKFLFVPKIMIRQKKTESLYQFRQRLIGELEKAEPLLKEVEFDQRKVEEHFSLVRQIEGTKEYAKVPTKLCDWCDYQKYCEEGDSTMILPSTERRSIEGVNKQVMWIYGAPFSGKTYLADKFPSPLMLNTDGNIKFVTAPYVSIKNDVTTEGHITKTKLAWVVFKETIEELAKKQNSFETIVVDLVEDLYEHCRLFMYKQMGITHESDDSFKAWDMVRTEFLSTIKQLMNLDYNIILISHEDATRDIMKRSGDKITSIKPNIPEKVANKLAGMVDIVMRCVSTDGNHKLTFKTDEVVFGGGRLTLNVSEIPCDYTALMKVYEDNVRHIKRDTPQNTEQPKANETPVETTAEPPKRKGRPRRAEPEKVVEKELGEAEDIPVGDPEEAEQPKTEEPHTVKRTRRARN